MKIIMEIVASSDFPETEKRPRGVIHITHKAFYGVQLLCCRPIQTPNELFIATCNISGFAASREPLEMFMRWWCVGCRLVVGWLLLRLNLIPST